MDDIQKELEIIRSRNVGGVLDPEEVVAYAKSNKSSALHSRFDWDVKKAAQAHWLLVARQIIRVHISVIDAGDGEKEPVRVYFSPTNPEVGSKRSYYKTEERLADPDMRRELVEDILNRMLSIYKNYPIPELKPIAAAIERVKGKLQIPYLQAAE